MKESTYHLKDWLALLRRPDGAILKGFQPTSLRGHGVVVYSGEDSEECRRIRDRSLEQDREKFPEWMKKWEGTP